jgi:hypothetical protein
LNRNAPVDQRPAFGRQLGEDAPAELRGDLNPNAQCSSPSGKSPRRSVM